MSENFLYKQLVHQFRGRILFTRNDLLKFFRQYDPDLNEATFTWRVFDLKRRNIIADVKKGIYTLHDKNAFSPSVTDKMISINKLIMQQYDAHFYSIWDTASLNELVELQATSFQVILEVEKGVMESVFSTLKHMGFTEVYIKPDENTVERYMSEAAYPVIIKPFLSRSPVQLIEDVKVPTLEKILVDLYCDNQIYFAYQGHQLEIIYRNAARRYSLNFSRLFTYAKRRSREYEIKSRLLKVLDNELKEIIE